MIFMLTRKLVNYILKENLNNNKKGEQPIQTRERIKKENLWKKLI